MSSLSKSKFTPGLNIYTMSKTKDMNSKTKTVSINSSGGGDSKSNTGISNQSGIIGNNGSNMQNLQYGNSGINYLTDLNSINTGLSNNPSSANSFRQTGILSMKKFKTTKSSRKKTY